MGGGRERGESARYSIGPTQCAPNNDARERSLVLV